MFCRDIICRDIKTHEIDITQEEVDIEIGTSKLFQDGYSIFSVIGT